ncbi:MAG TPA: helix-turn-helix transcriptional regulator [Gemmatimonadaceae bacterium]|nr:helix-turn-helix transcriptional regulator [Gemmatimonadaceae bacterium]
MKSDHDDAEAEIKEAIGKRIAEIRRKRHLSAQAVASKLGVSREAVTHIENGRNNLTAVSLWKLATLFDCNISDFFPTVPNGYGLTKVDTQKLEQEAGEPAAKWAAKLFGGSPKKGAS